MSTLAYLARYSTKTFKEAFEPLRTRGRPAELLAALDAVLPPAEREDDLAAWVPDFQVGIHIDVVRALCGFDPVPVLSCGQRLRRMFSQSSETIDVEGPCLKPGCSKCAAAVLAAQLVATAR